MIQAKNIKKSYDGNSILNGIDLTIEKGELVTIIGASGAGKTTLLQILGTLDKPDSGELIINNTPVHNLNDKNISKFRNNDIGFVFQFHLSFLFLDNLYLRVLPKIYNN